MVFNPQAAGLISHTCLWAGGSCGFTLRLMRLQPQAPGTEGAPDEAMIRK